MAHIEGPGRFCDETVQSNRDAVARLYEPRRLVASKVTAVSKTPTARPAITRQRHNFRRAGRLEQSRATGDPKTELQRDRMIPP